MANRNIKDSESNCSRLELNLFLTSSYMQFGLTGVNHKYSKCVTFWKDLIAVFMLQFFAAFRPQYEHIYLVFSAFTSISTALLATNKASVFFLIVWIYILNKLSSSASTTSFYIQLHLNTFQFTWTFLIAHSKAKSKGSGNKAFPCVRPL
jgi:hypothetical protein